MRDFSIARNYGMAWGTVSTLAYLTLYLVRGNLNTGWLGVLLFAGGLVVMHFIGMQRRQQLGGYIGWKEATAHIWVGAMISLVMNTMFLMFMYNIVDPGLNEDLKEMQIRTLEELRQTMGDATTDEQIDKIQESNPFGLRNSLLVLGGGVLMQFLLSGIVALTVKKNDPRAPLDSNERFTDRF